MKQAAVPPVTTLELPKGFPMQTDPNLAYLFAACTAVWVILFAYVAHLKKRSSSLAEQLRHLSFSTRATNDES